MHFAGASRFLLLVGLGVCFMGGEAFAQQIISSSHKNSPGQVKGRAQAAVILKSNEIGAAKSRPGEEAPAVGNIARLERQISARSAIIMDAASGRTLYSMNPDQPRQPASTIKVLTGLIALESLKRQELVPTSRRAANMPRSKVYLQSGKSYRADDLINAVLMASANDASVALAEKIAGSESAFARLMTSKARAMGARQTVIKTANGLTAQGQQSTARDLAVIFRQAMNHDEFSNRMGYKAVKSGFGQTIRTHNKALWQIHGTEGGKTGFTRAAGQTYVGKFRRGDSELVVALMGSQTMWDDVKHLVEFGFRQQQGMMAAADLDGSDASAPPGAVASLVVLDDSKKNSNL